VRRHVRRARGVYAQRREVLAAALRATFGDEVTFVLPPGGTAFWVRVAEGIDVDAWADGAIEHGVEFVPARRFTFDGRAHPFVRLGFAQLAEDELREAVRRMHRALLKRRGRGGRARS
jgi:GntR family transcriptional regulator/MocR family aminotransferase